MRCTVQLVRKQRSDARLATTPAREEKRRGQKKERRGAEERTRRLYKKREKSKYKAVRQLKIDYRKHVRL